MEEKNNKLDNLEKIEEPVALEEKEIERVEEKVLADNQNSEQEKMSTDTQNIEQEKIEYTVIPKYVNMKATISDYYDISRNFYAGFVIRFAAMLIDMLLIFALSRLVNTVTFGVLDFGYELPFIGHTPLYFITFFSYFVFMTLFFSQTIGKMILGIRVESNDGSKLPFLDVIFRELVGRFLNVVLFSLPYLIVPFTNKKKGLHDFIADSVVVKEDFSKLRKKINDTMRELNKTVYK
ncbi:RDD family protein [Gemelliphila palaticanis]|uniref:RDD family protein n=1 Tax=Gemelliphila palaticanis TaxID=81950 RepID=A0ABX2SX19_9BACL|nr:RDD family protein [Gemella palaticanis]MBF0714797.1 RDD family protein [Gemella palaticanis]NYS46727.1 RDD family protein [Gemella palaticanis]